MRGDAVKHHEIKTAVQERYGKIATGRAKSCCGGGGCDDASADGTIGADRLGYTAAELREIPKDANLGLGCGNPAAIASLKIGETVLDLGSGAGMDCFLAAAQVGAKGRVIGVDMTPDMLAKARKNAEKAGKRNVEFRLGEIEHLPVADASVDVVISNCVVNLSPDKPQVYREAFRVLKKGGRVAISDVVATAELPEEVKNDPALYAGCMAGAAKASELKSMLKAAGFKDVKIEPKDASKEFIKDWAPGSKLEDFVLSANVTARKA
jgi:SAM-dependent methyltransferase